MGGASSKAARKLPKRAETPTWAGTRTANPTSLAGESKQPEIPRASETKNDAIDKDSRDPQLLSNLSRLGPVRVDHHMQTFRLDEKVNQMHRSRAQSEVEATPSRATRNRVLSSTLSDLLRERNKSTSPKELQSISNQYGMDVAKLERLARFVNAPTIGEGTTVKTTDENGEELITSKAVWAEPPYSHTS